ncbi:hypothetical protein K438DRAFT_1787381 [Mycena galopus ATCC 62051]|nr:hypothetical protein K438DRAFT_1787381 [Mycena galopus ATCC 62051]
MARSPANPNVVIESAKERSERRQQTGTYKRLLIFCALLPFRQLMLVIADPLTDAPVACRCPENPQATDHKEWVPASNITRLCRMVAYVDTVDGKEIEQMTFYQNGVATGALTALGEAWSEIFIFGFSRGAFTARALSGLVQNIGIIDRSNLGAFHSIYDAYSKRNEQGHGKKKLQPDWGVPGEEVKIKVIGVWDTVKSLGFPKSDSASASDSEADFHDAETCKNVENAFHALALDEKRAAFSPMLWSTTDGKKTNLNLKQCWFPGAHSDVGGSYADAQPFDSSDLSLLWMIHQCSPFLAFNDSRLRKELERHGAQPWWGAQPLHDSFTFKYHLNGQEIRRPGQYFERQGVSVPPNAVSPQKEFVHASVRLRLLRARMLANHKKDNGTVVKTETMGLKVELDKEGTSSMVSSDKLSDKYDCRAMAGFRLELIKPAEPKKGYKWVKKMDGGKVIELMEDQLEEEERNMLDQHSRELLDDAAKNDGLEFPEPKGVFNKVWGYFGYS